MITIQTTQRCFQVEEDYITISSAMMDVKNHLLELTEVMTHHSDFPEFKTSTCKRKVLLQKQYIVEVTDLTLNPK